MGFWPGRLYVIILFDSAAASIRAQDQWQTLNEFRIHIGTVLKPICSRKDLTEILTSFDAAFMADMSDLSKV